VHQTSTVLYNLHEDRVGAASSCVSAPDSTAEVAFPRAMQDTYVEYMVQSTVIQDLFFAPTSMTVGGGFIAAGGQNSQVHGILALADKCAQGLPVPYLTILHVVQLDVRHLATGQVIFRGTVGGTVNNALHIAKDMSGVPYIEWIRFMGLARQYLFRKWLQCICHQLTMDHGVTVGICQ
jgi:hypothetical protein